MILVVGISHELRQDHCCGHLGTALSRANFSVAAGKITGTAAGKDARFFEACGARPVLDFTSAGYLSTYMLQPRGVARDLQQHTWATSGPQIPTTSSLR